jgi:hypothetical protein
MNIFFEIKFVMTFTLITIRINSLVDSMLISSNLDTLESNICANFSEFL